MSGQIHKPGQNISQQIWDDVGRRSGLKPEKRFKHRLGEIYVADGRVEWHEDMQYPHFLTSWAVARGEGNLKAFSYFRSLISSARTSRLTYARKEAERALKAAYEQDKLRAGERKLVDMIVAGEA